MKKILVVDDEPDVVELLNRSLRKAGYKVLASGDGAEALTDARRLSPDLNFRRRLSPVSYPCSAG